MHYLTEGDKLLCIHGGTITPKPQGERSMKLNGKPVLVEEDVLNINPDDCDCKGFPGGPPCTKVTSILIGKAQNITVDGEAPLLNTLMVITDAGMAVIDPVFRAKAAKRSARVLLPTGSGLESTSDSTLATESPTQERKEDEEDKESQEKPRDDQSWIYLRIIERHTQARVPNVRLSLKLANGQTFIAQSDGNGEIRLPNVAKGNFIVSGLTLEDMTGIKPKWEQLVGGPDKARVDDGFKLEVKPIPADQLKTEKEKAVQPISLPNVLRPDGTVNVARIEAHRVKDNDTLDSLAKHYGTDWKVIAHYNWGTIDPERINAALRDEVGCTQMDKENKNYRFSSKDVPGIVFVPIPWSQDKLETDKHYLLQLELMPAYRFALVDEADNPFPAIKYDIRFANEKEAQPHELSHRGRGLHLGAPPGPVTIRGHLMIHEDDHEFSLPWTVTELDAPLSGSVPFAAGLGMSSVLRIPLPGTSGLAVELRPRGWIPAEGSTSTIFIQDITGKSHLRLDYGYNIKSKTVDYHWNRSKKSVGSPFKIADHTTVGKTGQTIYCAAKYLKWGGRVLFAVGITMDALSIVQASNPLKRAAEVVTGWAGAWAGCKVVGQVGAYFGTAVEPGFGTVIGAVSGCIIGGSAGYYAASGVAGVVYDWAEGTVFTPLPETAQP